MRDEMPKSKAPIFQKKVIQRILEHLNLWIESCPQTGAPPEFPAAKKGHITYEPFDDGWPGHEDSSVTIE